MEKVIKVETTNDFSLIIDFDTGERKIFDVKPYLSKGVFQQLQDIEKFKQASVEYDTVVWPGEIDIAPETLYDRSVLLKTSTISNLKVADSRQKYGYGKLIHDAFYYDAINTFTDDIPFYLELAKKQKGTVLEFCCGTGRITVPLAKAGINITGVDMSASMLFAAKTKAKQEALDVAFIKSKMQSFKSRKKFDLIFIPFNSIQNSYKLSEIEKIFSSVKKHLATNGVFAFDIFNPSIHLMVNRENKRILSHEGILSDGKKIRIEETCQYDSAAQINRVTWYYQINDEPEIVEPLDMRCFFSQEIGALLKYNGFKIIQKYGSFKKEVFTSASSKQIFVCKML